MIAYDFEYYRPESPAEAARTFAQLREQGKTPMYYGGGTEILTRARLGEIQPDAVIDVKGIQDCTALERDHGDLVIGAACTLAAICDAGLFPFLSAAAGRVADHTTRCKITIGGNIAGSIPYREAALPLLLGSADAVIEGPQGRRETLLTDVFDGTLHLADGEFLVSLRVPREDLERTHISLKKTRLDWVDYPLLTVACAACDEGLRLAIAGLCSAPFRSAAMERALSQRHLSTEARIDEAAANVPADIVDDLHGSADYRAFVLRGALAEALHTLEGA